MDDAPHIQVEGLTRVYRTRGGVEVTALTDVTLRIDRGDFVAIVGPSGGGKSTLLNILGGLDEATAGTYHLDGEPVDATNDRQTARTRATKIAFIFQAFHLLERRPAIDSVELNLVYRGVDPSERERRAQDALRVTGLDARATQDASTLSGGQRQRVAIARAVASDAPLILADEPTGNLDSANALHVLDELDRLNSTGATIVMVTHAPEVAARARRVIRIADGRVVSDSAPQERPSREPAARAAPDEPRPMRFRDTARDAIASVWSRPAQTIAQALAVAIAVALMTATLGLVGSARAQVSETFDAQLNREVTVAWSGSDPHVPAPSDAPAVLDAIAGVEAAATTISLPPSRVSTFAAAKEVGVHVAYGDLAAAARLAISRPPRGPDALAEGQAYVGDLLSKDLQLGAVASAPTVWVNGAPYTVAGIITESPRLPMLRGEVVLGNIPGGGDTRHADGNAHLRTAAGAAQQVAEQVPLSLNPFAPETISVSAPTDSTELRSQIEQGVQVTLLAFTVLSLIVAVAALTNATLLAIQSRRSEIGLRKALGARSRQIGTLITMESVIIGAIGGTIGALIGMAAILAVTIANRWAPVLDLSLVPVALVMGVVLGAVGGSLAAMRAARLRPAENLRA